MEEMEDMEREVETSTAIATETPEVETQEVTHLEDLPRLEDLLKTEQEIEKAPELKGLKEVQDAPVEQDKPFEMKKDQQKAFAKRRLKLVTVIYSIVACLLLAFTCVNVATMISLNRDINKNTETINLEMGKLEDNLNPPPAPEKGTEIFVSLNEPRDYSDDKVEITFLDKLTILFRNLFG
ncbi:MAG: hypothetical protein MJ152_04300 [Clostridia bacterium]|nr:hypothetical protein [Clostridia bacterium]